MGETMYKDKDGNKIGLGMILVDDEQFEWIVIKNDKGNISIKCDDLMAVETVYPRAKFCKIKQGGVS